MLKQFNKGQSILCVAIIVLGFMAGGHIAGHIMFGILMFVGLIALVENVSWIRWIVYKSNVFLDIFFFQQFSHHFSLFLIRNGNLSDNLNRVIAVQN